MHTLTPRRSQLRRQILRSLRDQGFDIHSGLLAAPDLSEKESVRELHRESVRHNIERARAGLERHERRLHAYIAHGFEVIPDKISPRLVEIEPDSEDELLFRYARLHWSIPVSAGYGRRIRFLVYDDSNGKLIGLFGLGDPIFSLGPRDTWIGWSAQQRRQKLQCVMDLFALGAVPPYSQLLCGKLIALLATSSEVQRAFRRKYGVRKSRIRRQMLDKRLALLTTTSALGRSSLYNRLRYHDDKAFISVGFTRGSGEFQFVNGYYHHLRKLALANCDPTAKHSRWGDGFRNRREIIRKALPLLGLSPELVYHGIQREIMLAPLAANAVEFLRGEHQRLRSYHRSADDLFAWFRQRWLLPRAASDQRYQDFDAESYRLWPKT